MLDHKPILFPLFEQELDNNKMYLGQIFAICDSPESKHVRVELPSLAFMYIPVKMYYLRLH